MEEIRRRVEQVFGLNLISRSRKLMYVEARACYYVICAETTAFTKSAIARSLGKNHATILHALKEWEYMCKHNSELFAKYKRIRNKLYWDKNAPDKVTPEELLYMYHNTLLDNAKLRNNLIDKDVIIEQLKKQIK